MPVKKSLPIVKSKINFNYILMGLLIVAAFIIGSLYQKVKYLEKGGGGGVSQGQAGAGTQQTADQQIPPEPTITLDSVKDAYKKGVIKFGKENSKVLFIEVADPSCPYCHIAAGHNNELNSQVGDRFKLVEDGGTYVAPVIEMKKMVDAGRAAFLWLYTNGHGNGEMGTKALYCAFEGGKFWPVHDKLMTNEGYKLLNETVRNDKAKAKETAEFLASEFSANEMQTCLESGKYDGRLAEDTAVASGLGVSGTPGFFINSVKYAGAYSYKDMESAVNDALK